MKCRDIMQGKFVWLTPQSTVRQAAKIMKDQDVTFVPICELDGRLVGTITDRDIALSVVAEGRRADEPIGSVLSRDVVWCRPSDDLQKAELLMGIAHVPRILCVDESGALQGVIDLPDIVAHEAPGLATDILRRVWSH